MSCTIASVTYLIIITKIKERGKSTPHSIALCEPEIRVHPIPSCHRCRMEKLIFHGPMDFHAKETKEMLIMQVS